MNEREEKYFEKFKSTEISNEDIKKGEAKAKNLGDKKNDKSSKVWKIPGT